jgi:hypothetical protein
MLHQLVAEKAPYPVPCEAELICAITGARTPFWVPSSSGTEKSAAAKWFRRSLLELASGGWGREARSPKHYLQSTIENVVVGM